MTKAVLNVDLTAKTMTSQLSESLVIVSEHERDNPYYFFRANQQKLGTKSIHELSVILLSMNVIGTFWRATTRESIHIVWLGTINNEE